MRRSILLLLLPWCVRAAELRFAPAFTSQMVLQRYVPVHLSGTGPADQDVTVLLGDEQRVVRAGEDGRWRATFEPLPAGGPVAVAAKAGSSVTRLENVLIGDVWLFSGQSNMQMGLDEVEGGRKAMAELDRDLPIRLLVVPKAGSDVPAEDVGAGWKPCTTETLRKFSAVAGFFAAELRRNPELARVPLGLVDSSFGGTAIEAWTPPGELPEIPPDRVSGSMFGIPPGHLFNRMIAPLTACPLKGVVWYQGESNAGKPEVYADLLQNMIEQWRRSFRQPELPFLVVQLPAFEGRMEGLDFSWLREAQALACRRTPNAWCAVTYDTTDGFDLHPKEKEEIGRRLALLARREIHAENVEAHAPRVRSVSKEDGRLVVTFDQSVRVPDGAAPLGFAIAGADGEFRFAEAEIRGREVRLQSEGVAEPEWVRLAWGAMPAANITGASGLPAAPFRNDAEPPRSLAFQPLPVVYRIEAGGYSLETGRGGMIASLVVGGRQFLSHEPPGGTSVPGGFGARNLSRVTLLGPRRLELADDVAALEVAGDETTMRWTLRNRGADPLELHVMLSPEVGIEWRDGTAVLSRGDATIRIRGAGSGGGNKLLAKVPGGGDTELTLEFGSPR